MGRLVADAKAVPRDKVRSQYEFEFMSALAKMATPKRNTDVLIQINGYFKKVLDAASKQELLGLIDDYRYGLIPLIVPLTLIRHYIRRFDVGYLQGQVYLDPHPKELMLRNHV